MFIKVLKQRVCALLLFFNEYRVLHLCFTILVIMISASGLLESLYFDNMHFSFELLFKKFLPVILFELIIYVSYRAFCHVHFFTTIFKTLLISIFLCTPFIGVKIQKIRENMRNISSFTGQIISISGVVTSQEKEKTFLFSSNGSSLGNSIARFRTKPVLHAGQRCKLVGKVVQPMSFEDFDYRKYLFRKDVYSIIEVNEYECINGGNIFLEFRYTLERIVEKALPEPEASLLIGIMFGSKRLFSKEFNTALSSSGVSHIIAASGYNVALVASGVDMLTRKSSSKGSVLLKILCIWGFSIFSGLSSSLVRASTMTTFSLVALLFGRQSNTGATLTLCITILMLLNPFLIHDVGFLFSFASVVGLVYFPKCFENIRSKYLKESVLPTLTCMLFTLPISVIFFKKFSAISLISNIIVVPIISSSIYWGLVGTVLNIFLHFQYIFLIPYLQLSIFKYFVLLSSNVKMAEVSINGAVVGAVMYSILVLVCLIRYPIDSKNYYLVKASQI